MKDYQTVLTGKIKRETEKAILFATQEIERWFPKSQTTAMHYAVSVPGYGKQFDQLYISNWLAAKDATIQQMEADSY